MCTSGVSNVIYHKFSHGAAFYTLNGKNVNVVLESEMSTEITHGTHSNKDQNESKYLLSSSPENEACNV